jgi:hypothetical protein
MKKRKRLTPEEFVRLAREIPRDERVPYAFEKRFMARLKSSAAPDPLSFWTRALWRAVAPCFGVMLIAAALSFSHRQDVVGDADIDLDNAVLAPPDAAFDLSV